MEANSASKRRIGKIPSSWNPHFPTFGKASNETDKQILILMRNWATLTSQEAAKLPVQGSKSMAQRICLFSFLSKAILFYYIKQGAALTSNNFFLDIQLWPKFRFWRKRCSFILISHGLTDFICIIHYFLYTKAQTQNYGMGYKDLQQSYSAFQLEPTFWPVMK